LFATIIQMKNVLVVHYSQSGQLKEIAKNIAKTLLESPEIALDFHQIQLKNNFPFPWDKDSFFDAFPESFLQIPTALIPPAEEILNKKYDLIIFAYQVWFLSPSIPANSFLKSDYGQHLLKNTPVVTVNGSRNMWIMAQEKVKTLLKNANAKLVGNIALVDRAPNLISVITIVKWMFTGEKKKHLGIFPLPGVSQEDINNASRFGEVILSSLLQEDLNNLQPKLIQSGAVKVSEYLVKTDKKGNMIFAKWANLISKKKESRKGLLKVFYIYLILAIWIISPIVYILHLLTYPFTSKKRKETIAYYQGV